METMSQMPGYRTCEYLLVLVPHEDLSRRIGQVKNDFFDQYQVSSALVGRPQVTLLRFTQLEMMEEKLLTRLRHIAMGLPPTRIELDGFGFYPTHSLFINIVNPNQVKMMINSFKEARRLMKHGMEKPHFIDDPCIPVAIRLPKEKFDAINAQYRQKHFSGRFVADHIWMLKRRKGEKKYQVVERMPLQYLPVTTKQGALF